MQKKKSLITAIMVAILTGLAITSSVAKPKMVPISFAEIAEKVSPAVVNISSVRIVKSPFASPYQQFFNDPFTRDFFDHFYGPNWNSQPSQKSVSLGSGVLVDQDGYILTNNHVVEEATEIIVKLKDGKEYEADLIGTDPKTDLAVIKMKEKKKWPTADMGNSDQVRVGDWVLAVGSPFGLEQTVTSGIISAKSRTIGQGPYDDFLQTDASINRGNSGGPLVDMNGDIVGINTAIVSQSGGSIGIGFAIPINMARKIYNDIVSTGSVRRGWLGVTIQPLTPALSQQFNLSKNTKGVLINAVFKDGPAAKAGFKPGDVVIEFGGTRVKSDKDLLRMVANAKEGERLPVVVYRDGKKKRLYVRVGDRAVAEGQINTGSLRQQIEPKSQAGLLGIETSDLTDQAIRSSGSRNKQGVLITKVLPGGPAESAGIQAGDIIREVNRKAVDNKNEFKRIVKSLKPGNDLLLLVERRDYAIYVAMKIPSN